MAPNDHKKPVVNQEYLLERFSGKGGWTYAAIPEIAGEQSGAFGWLKISGSIDDFELKDCKLMPMGNGKLFLPVNATIRKAIGKKEGDIVKIILYTDQISDTSDDEIIECLKQEPEAYKNFNRLTKKEQHEYLQWINAAKLEDAKVERIVKMIDRLLHNLKLT